AQGEGLRHRQVAGQLDPAEVVALAELTLGELDEVGEREVLALVRRDAEPVPGRDAVGADLPLIDGALEDTEGARHAGDKRLAVDGGELRLGVVEVVDVDRREPEVTPAALDLIDEVARRQGMRAG